MRVNETLREMADSKEFSQSKQGRLHRERMSPPNCATPSCALPCRVPPSPTACKTCRVK